MEQPVTEIDESAIRWRDAKDGREGSHLLVVMHGYASYEGDLIELAPGLPDNVTVASLRAPITLRPESPAQQGAYAWFAIGGESPDRSLIDLSVDAVIAWLDSLEAKHSTEFATIGLMGFSQGGVMTLQLARTQSDRFDYLVQLSGFAHAGEHSGDARLMERQPRIPAFQAWGDHDPVIAPNATMRTREWMATHTDHEEHEYSMPHAVVPQEVADISAFISRQIG
ncbi:alpha/beta hydrolase [Agrococcus casei]|uniref:Phospholipase/Carboxylesterase n=1 Tax=Agrococcus casei LMG 22410 TaxID=1255656 RepID=A0A1R4F969_9MICO|nr:phospholipase/Carboxylesterase [Agrococcus casei LMG 22410]